MNKKELNELIEKNQDLFGKRVYHKKFGWGIIFDAPTLDFRVKFDNEYGYRRFPIYSYTSKYFDLTKTQ